ncbi:MAG: hypothetical protein ACRYGK_02110 [Janthinobacterium lividum]
MSTPTRGGSRTALRTPPVVFIVPEDAGPVSLPVAISAGDYPFP